MRVALLIPLLVFGLAGCSSNNSSSVGVGVSSGGYYGGNPWWYNDYYYYWGAYYPWCCDNPEDYDELVKKWWNGLDPQRQQEIKDKYQDWNSSNGEADLSTLRSDFTSQWNAMTPEQRQTLTDNRQNRLSVSNPDISPRLPLDDKSVSQLRGDNTGLTSSSLSQREGNLQARPHLPASLSAPARASVQPGVQPRIFPVRGFSGGGGRRR